MSEMADAIRALSEEKGIDVEAVKQTVANTIVAAYKKVFGKMHENCIVRFADDLSDVNVYARKEVVDGVYDPVEEIDLAEAQALNPDAELHDTLDIPLDPKHDFDRAAVTVGKQEAHRGFNESASNILMEEYADKVGKMIIGYYQHENKGTVYVDLGKVEGVLPHKYQSPREVYEKGDRIRAIIKEVKKTSSGVQLILSRADPELVREILELEVPELQDNTIAIMGMAREAGYRTKIAVQANRIDVDPVGACVGMKGVRIQNVIRELEGEKIDVIHYADDPHVYIANALTPAEVRTVVLKNAETREALVVVPDEDFSIAIGKQGQNVRLAGRLTGWALDVKAESEVTDEDLKESAVLAAAQGLFDEGESNEPVPGEEEQEEVVYISQLPGADLDVCRRLTNAGYGEIEKFIEAYDNGTFNNLTGVLQGFTKDDIDKVYSVIEENVDFEEEGAAEEEEYYCPECGARITPDMTRCPNCGVELSFEEE